MLVPLAGCGETRETQREVYAMDTVMTLTAYGKKADAGLRAAESIISSMDAALDPELSTSTTYAINHAQGGSTVISGQIAKMLNTAHTVYERSEGALDLTIYPLVKRWGFVDGKYYVPTGEEIASDLSRLCFDQLVLTSFPSSGSYAVSLPSYGELSFASVAKGCAADNAVEAMRQAGVTSAIISLGGNVQTLGVKPDGTNWNVAVQDPNNTLQSATIICSDGTLADCLSTAMFVLGESRAINYWRTYGGFEMILVTKENQVICTKGLIEEFTLTNENYGLKFVE